MKIKSLFSLFALSVCFSGCLADLSMNNGYNPGFQNAKYSDPNKRQKIGTIGGVAGGALLGSHVMSHHGFNGSLFGAVFGGVLGGLVGNKAGAYIDKRIQEKIAQNTFYALNNGQVGSQYNWSEGQNYGSTVPTRDFYLPHQNSYCREFYQTVFIAGKEQKAYGTACRMPDGAWKIVN